MRAIFAASAMLIPLFVRSRRSFGPSAAARPAGGFAPRAVPPSACLIPGTLICLTSLRYLMRFKTLTNSGPYNR